MTFLKGNICRIYLENFLTYNKIQIEPKPYLNVIIGPNGTGKSSVLCGICIGLGGKPELTGRGKSLVEYIKNGEDHAKIEIELHNADPNEENYVIRREFSKSSTGGGRSKWYLQGRETSEEKIKGLVTRLGIQVGNLCQFLPQDRVIEFAKMDKVELLQSTEKAVGEIELYEQHQTLQDFGKSQQEVDTQLTNLRVELENEIRINSQLEDQVKNIMAKEDLDKSIEALEQTLLFCRYNKTRDRHKELGEQLSGPKGLKSQKDKIENEMRPKREEVQNIRDKIRKDDRFLKMQYHKLEELIQRNENIVTRLKEEEENIDKAKEDFKNTQDRASRREKEISDKRNGIKLLEAQLEDVNENELQRQLQNLTLLISENNEKIENIRDNIAKFETALKIKLNDIEKCCHELRKIRDGKNKKLQILQSRNRSAFLAAEWLLNNRDKPGLFKGVVHEPLFFMLECGDLDSKYVENVISNQDLIAFVCEEKDDVRTLKLEANKHKWAINILYSPPVDPRTYQPTYRIENLRPFGFVKYLRDTIRAPPSILGYLCRNYNIHNIPIAQKADLNKVPEDIKLYFVGNQRFFIRRSRYDQRISTDVSEINAPYFLRQASNSEDEERLMFQLEGLRRDERSLLEQIKPLKEQHRSAETHVNELRYEKSEKSKKLNSRKSIESRIEAHRSQLLEKERNRIDLNLEKEKMKNSLQIWIKKMVKTCHEMSTCEDDMKKLNNICLENSFSILEYQCKEKDISKSMENEEIEFASKLEEIKKVEEEKSKTKQNAEELLKNLCKSLHVEKPEDIIHPVREKLREKSNNKTIEDLEREKTEKEVHRSCLVVSDEKVLVEYEKRRKTIERLEEKKYRMEQDLQRKVNNIQQVRESWLRNVRQLTSQISEHFSSYMTQLGCAGEVQLDTGSNENDFSKYGLAIRVKFRDTEKLKELSAQQQSGGERSVTTALYLLALQQTPTRPVPFRCVDEINQGMDPTNERKMFTMLVESMTRGSASQYFIVSPKLLPNLPYNKYVVFLNLFNWTSSVNIQSLSTSKILRRLKKSVEERKNRKYR
ncbi:UNVERIFIED_CONTAM: hypothetical protein RMT77_013143 [Armadillidium vulgare]